MFKLIFGFIKTIFLTVIIGTVLSWLAYTNPETDQFLSYYMKTDTLVTEEKATWLEKGIIALETSLVDRQDYLFFSTYDVSVIGYHAVGLAGNYFEEIQEKDWQNWLASDLRKLLERKKSDK